MYYSLQAGDVCKTHMFRSTRTGGATLEVMKAAYVILFLFFFYTVLVMMLMLFLINYLKTTGVQLFEFSSPNKKNSAKLLYTHTHKYKYTCTHMCVRDILFSVT